MELKGSKTEKNLEAAFAGESQARNKYTFFAAKAEAEGYDQTAEVFYESAENEKAHARRILDLLKRVGDTKANLKAAAEGEHYEWTKMYPEFERVAREEGFTEIANFFKRVAEVEEHHERRYLESLKDVEKEEVFKKGKAVVWQCRSCGWFSKGTEAPSECPTCQAPQSGFDVTIDIERVA